jgi:FAD/FMN-containing dehydrogenase
VTMFVGQLDPGPGATIGGMLSNGCSGSASLFNPRKIFV